MLRFGFRMPVRCAARYLPGVVSARPAPCPATAPSVGLCGVLFALILLANAGCATSALRTARRDFYRGNATNAVARLEEAPENDTNKVLFYMERGTIRQATGDYRASARDYQEAVSSIRALDKISVTRSAASMLTNDDVITFRGFIYERVLLHAFAAHNYLALRLWDDAAVEARNIVSMLESRDGFPDDAYSRYLAGLCLELQGDSDAARRQYEAADELVSSVSISPGGQIAASSASRSNVGNPPSELVCLVAIGRGPDGHGNASGSARWGGEPYAEIYAGQQLLGRSYALSDTRRLLSDTRQKLAALQAAKDVGRVAIKYGVASAVADKHEGLGALLWVIMLALESQAERRWETLPLSLQVARFPCPENLEAYTVLFKRTSGQTVARKTIRAPISRRRRTFVTFCRDIP